MKLLLSSILFLTSFAAIADSYDDDLKKLFELTEVKTEINLKELVTIVNNVDM